jgi:DNA-binding NtrC family response regulator
LQQIGQREGHWRGATPQALARLTRHTWPGNVRELRNALQRAWVMTTGAAITPRWLP